MKLSELIRLIGDDNVTVQPLDTTATNVSRNEKGGTSITFVTDATSVDDLAKPGGGAKIGLVVWLPRDRVKTLTAPFARPGVRQ